MKIIDLLNKIANVEEVPKKIKFKGIDRIYEYDRMYNWFEDNSSDNCKDIFYICELNDEVEIIEDEPRNIEVCGSLFTRSEYNRLAGIEEDKKIERIGKLNQVEDKQNLNNYMLRDKINEIIDVINKGDKQCISYGRKEGQ